MSRHARIRIDLDAIEERTRSGPLPSAAPSARRRAEARYARQVMRDLLMLCAVLRRLQAHGRLVIGCGGDREEETL